jgi:hypothetical protein
VRGEDGIARVAMEDRSAAARRLLFTEGRSHWAGGDYPDAGGETQP